MLDFNDYAESRELEGVLVEFLQYLAEQDIFLCEPTMVEEEYSAPEFRPVPWTPDQSLFNLTIRECQECGFEDGHAADDYICVACRTRFWAEEHGWRSEEGYALHLEPHSRFGNGQHKQRQLVFARLPDMDQLTLACRPLTSLAFSYVDYKRNQLRTPLS